MTSFSASVSLKRLRKASSPRLAKALLDGSKIVKLDCSSKRDCNPTISRAAVKIERLDNVEMVDQSVFDGWFFDMVDRRCAASS